MCVILDASARDDVFGRARTAAGTQLFEWLETPWGRLVLGGKLTRELATSDTFAKWAEVAVSDGRVKTLGEDALEKEIRVLSTNWLGKSDDQHVIALARVSRAHILYADDGNLCDDFRNPELVPNPRGRLYPTGETLNAARHRRGLLNRTDLCPSR